MASANIMPDTESSKDSKFTYDSHMVSSSNNCVDSEFEAIRTRVKEMEEEAAKLKELQKEVEENMIGKSSGQTPEEKKDVDSRSVYVGNVDYSATAAELQQHFHGCGSVNRVTILCDHYSGHPKGFAYIEFTDKESIHNAVTMNDTLFKGRLIKVIPKRTNLPGVSMTERGFHRGRSFRPRGFSPYFRSRPRAFGRGRFFR